MRFVERRIHGIGWIPIVGFLEVCGEVIPIGAENIETSSCDHAVSNSEQWAFSILRIG